VRLLTAMAPELQSQDSFISLANYRKAGEIQGQHALQTHANGGEKNYRLPLTQSFRNE
jgi:hypothetical protein